MVFAVERDTNTIVTREQNFVALNDYLADRGAGPLARMCIAAAIRINVHAPEVGTRGTVHSHHVLGHQDVAEGCVGGGSFTGPREGPVITSVD